MWGVPVLSGWDYLVLYFFLFFLLTSRSLLSSLVLQIHPGSCSGSASLHLGHLRLSGWILTGMIHTPSSPVYQISLLSAGLNSVCCLLSASPMDRRLTFRDDVVIPTPARRSTESQSRSFSVSRDTSLSCSLKSADHPVQSSAAVAPPASSSRAGFGRPDHRPRRHCRTCRSGGRGGRIRG